MVAKLIESAKGPLGLGKLTEGLTINNDHHCTRSLSRAF